MINSAQVIETKRRIATMQAWLDGKTIERSCPDVGWRVVKEPQWQWDRVDYRVKPEPLTGEGWAYECDLRSGDGKIYPLSQPPGCNYKTVRVKWEVVPCEETEK